ncbi:hypothetical protein B566_EDAN010337 [Ephemera danica]|nr:hypothetical protein B566_EDAN010337 [Ephemera danica]
MLFKAPLHSIQSVTDPSRRSNNASRSKYDARSSELRITGAHLVIRHCRRSKVGAQSSASETSVSRVVLAKHSESLMKIKNNSTRKKNFMAPDDTQPAKQMYCPADTAFKFKTEILDHDFPRTAGEE